MTIRRGFAADLKCWQDAKFWGNRFGSAETGVNPSSNDGEHLPKSHLVTWCEQCLMGVFLLFPCFLEFLVYLWLLVMSPYSYPYWYRSKYISKLQSQRIPITVFLCACCTTAIRLSSTQLLACLTVRTAIYWNLAQKAHHLGRPTDQPRYVFGRMCGFVVVVRWVFKRKFACNQTRWKSEQIRFGNHAGIVWRTLVVK